MNSITDVASILTMIWCIMLLCRIIVSEKTCRWGMYLLYSSVLSIVITFVLSVLNVYIQYVDPNGTTVSTFQTLCMILVIIEGLIIVRYS